MPEVVVVDDSDTEEERAPTPTVRNDRNREPSRANGKSVSNPPPTASAPSTSTPVSTPSSEATASMATAPAATTSVFLSNRRALEQERLERQKRLRGDVNAPQSSSDEEESSLGSDGAGDEDRRATKRRKVDPSAAATNGATTVSAQAGPSSLSRDQASASVSKARSGPELFLDGEVRPTRNRYVHDGRKRFSIADVIGDVSRLEPRRVSLTILQKDDLSLVIASSYCHEPEWISRHFPDPSLVPTIHIRQPKNDAENDKWTMETAETGGGLPGSATVWAFMPYPGFRGTMHMKFMLVSASMKMMAVIDFVALSQIRSIESGDCKCEPGKL